MGYIQGGSRTQQQLFPEVIDEYISLENPVRFLEAFVESLDLKQLGFQRATPAATGRPAYNPKGLLKLYLYGYLNQLRSSRKLEREAHRNVEVMWLLGKLTPDFKTIADFRKDNAKAFKQVFREFTLLCKKLELFGKELLALDGSKFKAMNNTQKNFTKTKVEKTLQEIDEKLETYLAQLDAGDAQDAEARPLTVQELQAKIGRLEEKKQRYEALKSQMEETGETQVSLTDPDSRSMPKSPKVDVGYNVQVAVDAKHHLIVEQEVTNAVTDQHQLSDITIEAKETLGVAQIKDVADTGYYDGAEVKRCQEAGIEMYVSKPITSANTKLGLLGKEKFVYEKERDVYRCPGGQDLRFRFETEEKGRQIRYYSTSACKTCSMKPKCTRNKRSRRITRWVHEHILEEMQERVEAHPEMMKQRKMIVEHPFGTIKHWNDQGYFLMKGLAKVGGEMSLSALMYNIKRVINILGVPKMIEALAKRASLLPGVQTLWRMLRNCMMNLLPLPPKDGFPTISVQQPVPVLTS